MKPPATYSLRDFVYTPDTQVLRSWFSVMGEDERDLSEIFVRSHVTHRVIGFGRSLPNMGALPAQPYNVPAPNEWTYYPIGETDDTHKLRLVLQYTAIPLTPQEESYLSSDFIMSIKLMRARTGCGLRTAKFSVDGARMVSGMPNLTRQG